MDDLREKVFPWCFLIVDMAWYSFCIKSFSVIVIYINIYTSLSQAWKNSPVSRYIPFRQFVKISQKFNLIFGQCSYVWTLTSFSRHHKRFSHKRWFWLNFTFILQNHIFVCHKEVCFRKWKNDVLRRRMAFEKSPEAEINGAFRFMGVHCNQTVIKNGSMESLNASLMFFCP